MEYSLEGYTFTILNLFMNRFTEIITVYTDEKGRDLTKAYINRNVIKAK